MKNKGQFKKGHTSWNKGLKKENNPLYGIPRSEETKRKIKETKSKQNCKHSPEIRKKISENMKGYIPWNKDKKCPQFTGEKNPNWKGGITKLWRKIRNSKEMKTWKTRILARDNYKCKKCGESENLEVHHKMQLNAIMEKYNLNSLEKAFKCKKLWDIDNGITLCRDCHNRIKIIRNYVNYSGEPITVYLSGYINNKNIEKCIEWREKIKDHYNSWNDGEGYPIAWLDPTNGDLGKIKNNGMESSLVSGRALVMRDFNSVKNSDLIVANLNTFGHKRCMIGTFYELAWAWEYHKPIIIITDDYYKNHPFVKDTASIIVKNVNELIESKYINWFFKGWVNAKY